MLLIIWLSGYNVGFHADEIDMNNYGKANIAYYLSGGKDTSFLGSLAYTTVHEDTGGHNIDTSMKYYGSAFEYLAVGFNKITGLDKGKQEFNSRHAINQFLGIVAILFAGLIAQKIKGWRAAIITSWLLFLTPTFFGSILFNTKDIPFCAGYVTTLYFIASFLMELPTPAWKTTLLLMLSFAFTTATRIGGLLLIFYLPLFIGVFIITDDAKRYKPFVRNIASLLAKVGVTIGGGMALVILTWPYVLRSPLANLMATFNVVKKYPVKIKLVFEGTVMDSLKIPPGYLPEFLSITLPVFILIALVISSVLLLYKIKKYNWKIILLITFASVFPVVYAITGKVALYSGWRHFLFIYPGLCIIAGLGLSDIMNNIKKPLLQIGFIALCILGISKPVIWSIKNHPYEYTYFNEFAGGYKQAYYNYETDYWEITVKNTIEWLMKNEPVIHSKDTVTIGTNTDAFLKYYISRNFPEAKIKIVYTGCRSRCEHFWNYGIYNSLFMEPNFLEDCFPPCLTIHSEDINGMPATVIIKDTLRYDYIGIQEAKNSISIADSFFTMYLKYCDNNVGLYGIISYVKAALSHPDDAIFYGNKCLQYTGDYYAFCGLGKAYEEKGMFDKSISYLKEAQKIKPYDMLFQNIFKSVHQKQQEVKNKSGYGK